MFTRYNDNWIICKHKNRSTYECPGGKRKYNEDIYQLAKRELAEETGIQFSELFLVSKYKIGEKNDVKYGRLLKKSIYNQLKL